MESNEFDKLLERYWNCETSDEEERTIRQFFSEGSVPDHLSKYEVFFLWRDKQAQSAISSDFEQRILSRLDQEMQPKPVRKVQFFYSFLKVAASILIILTAGLGVYTHHMEEKRIEQTYYETYSDPEIAMKKAQAALNKISSTLSKGSNAVENLLVTDTVRVKK